MKKLFLISTIVMFISCNNSIVFEKYKTFENQQWNTDSVLSFDYTITDTISTYKLRLNIRHSVEYEYQNLFLFIDSDTSRDTIELLLADKKGKWLGSGVGDIREIKSFLAVEKRYSKKENNTINIEQAMRYGAAEKIKNLKFIDAVGISIIKEE